MASKSGDILKDIKKNNSNPTIKNSDVVKIVDLSESFFDIIDRIGRKLNYNKIVDEFDRIQEVYKNTAVNYIRDIEIIIDDIYFKCGQKDSKTFLESNNERFPKLFKKLHEEFLEIAANDKKKESSFIKEKAKKIEDLLKNNPLSSFFDIKVQTIENTEPITIQTRMVYHNKAKYMYDASFNRTFYDKSFEYPLFFDALPAFRKNIHYQIYDQIPRDKLSAFRCMNAITLNKPNGHIEIRNLILQFYTNFMNDKDFLEKNEWTLNFFKADNFQYQIKRLEQSDDPKNEDCRGRIVDFCTYGFMKKIRFSICIDIDSSNTFYNCWEFYDDLFENVNQWPLVILRQIDEDFDIITNIIFDGEPGHDNIKENIKKKPTVSSSGEKHKNMKDGNRSPSNPINIQDFISSPKKPGEKKILKFTFGDGEEKYFDASRFQLALPDELDNFYEDDFKFLYEKEIDETSLERCVFKLINLKKIKSKDEILNILSERSFGLLNVKLLALPVQNALCKLWIKKIIQFENEIYVGTDLGKAIFSTNIDPNLGYNLYNDLLNELEREFVLKTYFHSLFIIIPYDIKIDVDLNLYHNEFIKLSESEKRILADRNINEVTISMNIIRKTSEKNIKLAFKRSYIAFMMTEIWNKKPLTDVAKKYNVSKEWLETTLYSTIIQAHLIVRFSKKLGKLKPLEWILPDLIKKSDEFTNNEFKSLLELDCINVENAKKLFDNGFKTINSIIKVVPCHIMNILHPTSFEDIKKMIDSAKNIIEKFHKDEKKQRNLSLVIGSESNAGIINRNEKTNFDPLIWSELSLFEQKHKFFTPELWKESNANGEITFPHKIGKDAHLDIKYKPLKNAEDDQDIPTLWSFMDKNGSEERKKLIEQEIEDPFSVHKS